ncbi:uncharacterized protein UV8b_01910 [Ustilaginoidea virens]|uniref:HCP-like protein n=1 Tax=Ustilaginoidea virens TaxID=1159556 RepID=A0A8E5HMG8_USTVR|nr:uncharacterized protein UV8b_01910 [Ustilaginoidea virens]QUC17669.1 hypothetical protein UV8b_01910 [Ustilaginoidea virens]
MGLRDMLRKKDGTDGTDNVTAAEGQPAARKLGGTDITFVRTATSSQERVCPPPAEANEDLLSPKASVRSPRRSLDVFWSNRPRSESASSQASHSSRRRLSERLHLSRSPESSDHVPVNLPDITQSNDPDDQSQWERRATLLAKQPIVPGVPGALPSLSTNIPQLGVGHRDRSAGPSPVSSKTIDQDIQEAIRLHEEGDLERSTSMFGQLADPQGANNPLSQVLYGLALRHGWGCEANLARAVKYLTAAASSSAAVEQLALEAGMKKGGAAKGELVMAIFELANCFRHGWGLGRDPFAAKQYYETAANLGDSDAMNEVAWCYLEGFGCKKDKHAAAQYYRLAERSGSKTLGNTWIWKEKYDPHEQGKK